MNLKLVVFIALGVLLGLSVVSGTHKQKGGGKAPVEKGGHKPPPPPPSHPAPRPPPSHPQKPSNPPKEITININVKKGSQGGGKGKSKH